MLSATAISKQDRHYPSRRRFLAGVTAAGSLSCQWSTRPLSQLAAREIDEYDKHNIKLARRVPGSLNEQDMNFLQQLGIRWVRVDLTRKQTDPGFLLQLQRRLSNFGIRIYSAVHPVQSSIRIGLGLPGRDTEIKEYQTFLRSLGKLNIPVAGYAFHPGNTYSTGTIQHRGYQVREFDLDVFRNRVEKQRFDRTYCAEEMWNHYRYFMEAVLPVAEQSNVRMALHPDDPPVSVMNGVAKLFVNYDGMKQAEAIAGGSDHWGLIFCVGTWSEGGQTMGKDVFEMIRDFGGRDKLFAVHFRNVSGTLPRFYETFPDDGYQDMYRVMTTLREVGFQGSAIPDHIPQMINDTGLQQAGVAYCIAYMRALLQRANHEVG